MPENHSTGEFSHAVDGLHEGNLRVPFLVRWPGNVASGTTSDEAIGLWDILPTLTQLAAVSRSIGSVDGRSLADVWQKQQKLKGRLFQWKSDNSQVLVSRENHWKAVLGASKRYQLFDLSSDAAEERDVSAEHTDVLQRLTKAD
jgi:arylsulfatase A-like enzyme